MYLLQCRLIPLASILIEYVCAYSCCCAFPPSSNLLKAVFAIVRIRFYGLHIFITRYMNKHSIHFNSLPWQFSIRSIEITFSSFSISNKIQVWSTNLFLCKYSRTNNFGASMLRNLVRSLSSNSTAALEVATKHSCPLLKERVKKDCLGCRSSQQPRATLVQQLFFVSIREWKVISCWKKKHEHRLQLILHSLYNFQNKPAYSTSSWLTRLLEEKGICGIVLKVIKTVENQR